METESRTARKDQQARWSSRPFLSAALRVFIFLFPTVASLGTAVLLSRLILPPTDTLSTAMWWVTILGSSFVVLFFLQRFCRRLLPLAVLLKLTLTFPDRAPSRYRVARQSGNIAELRQRMAEPGQDGDQVQRAAETILALAAALGTHDRHTRGHSERVRVFTDMLAEELIIPQAERERLRWAALLHDVGKLEVPSEVLDKAGPLDDDEWKVVKRHPSMGMQLIAPLVSWLGPQAKTIEDHHERFDGTGYPNGKSGEEISIGGRIVSVADAYETMTAARSYKKPLSAAAAREELSRCAGKQFDPGVVRAMMNISLGKLWWRVGALAWVAQIPFVGPASRYVAQSPQTAAAAATTLATAGLIAAASVTGPVTDAPLSPQPEAYQAASATPTFEPPSSEPRKARKHPEDRAAPETVPSAPSAVPMLAEGSIVGPPAAEQEQSDDERDQVYDSSKDRTLLEYVVDSIQDTVGDLPIPGH